MEFINKLKAFLPDILISQAKNYADNLIVYLLKKMPVDKKQELGRFLASYFIKVSDRILGEEGSENIEQAIQDTFDDILIGAHMEFDKDD